jgi:pyruvate/2-oxoglutarate dehydrogenase complex dihydrolipoamide acyltransferase (E2) component
MEIHPFFLYFLQVGESLLELLSGTHTAQNVEESSKKKVLATPAVRHLARKYGIKLEDVLGSGEDGRILDHDVMKYVENKEGLNEELEAISRILPKAAVPVNGEQSTTHSKDLQPVKNGNTDKVIHVRYALFLLNKLNVEQ